MNPFLRAVAALLFAAFPIVAETPKPEKDDVRAREVVEQFVKAMFDKNLAEVMKVVSLPYCNDARNIITDKKKLEEHILELFEKKRPQKYRLHIRESATLAAFRERKKAPTTRGASLGEVLSKRHRVVYVEVELDGKFQPIWIGVNLDEPEAKVVGTVG